MSARVDPATLSQEIDETRADVGETLEALQAKLSPGQLLDQAVTYCTERGYELARRVGDTAREHPIPTALVGAGVLWYISRRRRGDEIEIEIDESLLPDEEYGELYGEGAYVEGSSAEGISAQETYGAGTSGRRERLRAAGSAARRRASALRERASGAASSLRERASGAASTLRERAGRTSGAVRGQARYAGDELSELMREQPLLLGAVGMAIGAVVAALLPSSETEDELLGEVSDRTFERAKQKGTEQYEKVRETVKRAADGARRAVSESEGDRYTAAGGVGERTTSTGERSAGISGSPS